MKRCSVVIPVHGQVALTRTCLDALLPLVSRDDEVVVVDDGSNDGTADLLTSFGDALRVVTHDENRGFADACNSGAAVATGTYVVFLNNDTIPQPGWLDALVRYADVHRSAAAVGSKLLSLDGVVQHAGVVVCQDRYPRHIYSGFPGDHPAVSQPRRFQIVTAASVLLRREAFEELHGFDPAFRNGYEDVDLCLRLVQRGYEIHYCSESVAYHLESVSVASLGKKRRARDIEHNKRLYRERWIGRVEPDDVRYYLEDGLLRLGYPGSYPIEIEVSPSLARLEREERDHALERIAVARARQVGLLSSDLVDVTVALAAQTGSVGPSRGQTSEFCTELDAIGDHRALLDCDEGLLDRIHDLQAALSARLPVGSGLPTRSIAYRALVRRIREVAQATLPQEATVLVASRGDPDLLELDGRTARHFLQTEDGTYAGRHPVSSDEAILQLESLRAEGAGFLLVPSSTMWWLDYYEGFRQHLEGRYRGIASEHATCSIYALEEQA